MRAGRRLVMNYGGGGANTDVVIDDKFGDKRGGTDPRNQNDNNHNPVVPGKVDTDDDGSITDKAVEEITYWSVTSKVVWAGIGAWMLTILLSLINAVQIDTVPGGFFGAAGVAGRTAFGVDPILKSLLTFLAVYAYYYTFGSVTGGDYNFMITFVKWIAGYHGKRMSAKTAIRVLGYAFIELLFAFLGGLTVFAFIGRNKLNGVLEPSTGGTPYWNPAVYGDGVASFCGGPAPERSCAFPVFTELFMSAGLAYFIILKHEFLVNVDLRLFVASSSQAIAAVWAVIAGVGCYLTGPVLNPTLLYGTRLAQLAIVPGSPAPSVHYMYWVPLLGPILALVLHIAFNVVFIDRARHIMFKGGDKVIKEAARPTLMAFATSAKKKGSRAPGQARKTN